MAQTRKTAKTFEQELEDLSAITQKLGSGELSLEESIRIYEEGVHLVTQLQKELGEMDARLEKLDLATGEITEMKETDDAEG